MVKPLLLFVRAKTEKAAGRAFVPGSSGPRVHHLVVGLSIAVREVRPEAVDQRRTDGAVRVAMGMTVSRR